MKHINKAAEPGFFVEWKNGQSPDWNPGWAALDAEIKKRLANSLIQEQGGICCYCNGELLQNNYHIEHFRPKSRPEYSGLALDYNNLFVSCQSNLEPGEPRHCGMKKDDWFDEDFTLDPSDEDTESKFTYFPNGKIAGNDEAANEMIKHLGLGITKLIELRKAAIVPVLDAFSDDDSDDIIQQLMDSYSQRTPSTGHFAPYCSAIVGVLAGFME